LPSKTTESFKQIPRQTTDLRNFAHNNEKKTEALANLILVLTHQQEKQKAMN